MKHKTRYFIVKTFDSSFPREFTIYNDWMSNDKEYLIEKIRQDLENEVLLEPVKLELKDDWIYVNGSPDKWIQIAELFLI